MGLVCTTLLHARDFLWFINTLQERTSTCRSSLAISDVALSITWLEGRFWDLGLMTVAATSEPSATTAGDDSVAPFTSIELKAIEFFTQDCIPIEQVEQ